MEIEYAVSDGFTPELTPGECKLVAVLSESPVEALEGPFSKSRYESVLVYDESRFKWVEISERTASLLKPKAKIWSVRLPQSSTILQTEVQSL
jgi:hypothetical protein